MNFTIWWRRLQVLLLLVGLLGLVSVSGCASNSELVRHSFEFSAVRDSPDIEVLDFRYGDTKQPGASGVRWRVEKGEPQTGGSTYGDMRQGFDLYVKWRIKATGEVLEDTADLRPRLPKDITDHRVYFVVRQRQLWVYLITPTRQVPPANPGPVRGYGHLQIITLYPLPAPGRTQ